MLKSLKLPSAFIMSLFCFAPLVQADEQLLDGVHPFICDDSAFVFLESNSGWEISNSHALEVKSTQNGWRVEDTLTGEVWYLRQERSGSWVLNGLYEDGHFTVDCIDLADSIAEVITLIKPRLDLAILDTERALRETASELSDEVTKNSQLSAQNKSLMKTVRKTEAAIEASKAELETATAEHEAAIQAAKAEHEA